MITKYQLVIIGNENPFDKVTVEVFVSQLFDLGVSPSAAIVLNRESIGSYISNAPTVVLYFGRSVITESFQDEALLARLLGDSNLVVPVVSDLDQFTNLVPASLFSINGFKCSSSDDVAPLISVVLEGFNLLRKSRRLFISYKRRESRGAAIQCYEKLEAAGFDVFLDTHSVRPGDKFQDELWQRLVDTDVVVLLNTPGFLSSQWTREEVAKASAMSVGIFQLVWPGHLPERMSELSDLFLLSADNFENQAFEGSKCCLADALFPSLISRVECMRARNLGARQDNIVSEFVTSARELELDVVLQPQKYLELVLSGGRSWIFIPTIGVPQAWNYNETEVISKILQRKPEKLFLLFDSRNIRDIWMDHLHWLDQHLPVTSVSIVDIDKWLINNTSR